MDSARVPSAPRRIVAVTAHVSTTERDRCLSAGMLGYLSKPFCAHELFALVEQWSAALPAGSAAGAGSAVDGILHMFQESARERVSAVATAVGERNAPAIDRAAHAFRSAAHAVGAASLATLLQELEDNARAGNLEGSDELVDQIRTETGAVLSSFRARLAQS